MKQIYLHFIPKAGPSLERVPRVPGTRDILSSYVMAPVNFSEISGQQLLGTREILRPLISGTRGLKFLKRALIKVTVQIRLHTKLYTTHLNGFAHFEIRLIFQTPVTIDSDLNKVEKRQNRNLRYQYVCAFQLPNKFLIFVSMKKW